MEKFFYSCRKNQDIVVYTNKRGISQYGGHIWILLARGSDGMGCGTMRRDIVPEPGRMRRDIRPGLFKSADRRGGEFRSAFFVAVVLYHVKTCYTWLSRLHSPSRQLFPCPNLCPPPALTNAFTWWASPGRARLRWPGNSPLVYTPPTLNLMPCIGARSGRLRPMTRFANTCARS